MSWAASIVASSSIRRRHYDKRRSRGFLAKEILRARLPVALRSHSRVDYPHGTQKTGWQKLREIRGV